MKHKSTFTQICCLVLLMMLLTCGCDAVTSEQPIAAALKDRLKATGISGVDIAVLEESPLRLEVTLQYESDRASPEDIWRLMIVEREIELLFLDGYPVSTYTIVASYPAGDETINLLTHVHPDQVRENLFDNSDEAIVDHQIEILITRLFTAELPMSSLAGKLNFVSVDSTTGVATRDATKAVHVTVSTPDKDTVDQILEHIGMFMGSLIAIVNNDHDAQIALLQVDVVEAGNGEHLGGYYHDYELGRIRWWFAEGIQAPYMHVPDGIQLEKPTPTPIQSPLATPTPLP